MISHHDIFARSLYLLRWQRLATGILTILLFLVAIGAIIYGLTTAVKAVTDIIVATIAGVTSLLSAVFAYIFQRTKDLEMAQIQHELDLNLAKDHHQKETNLSIRKTKQENYARILEKLAPYIRNPSKNSDDFTTAYLHTWVMGSPAVVQAVGDFLKSRDFKSLDKLLLAMRKDLRHLDAEDYYEYALDNVSSKGLFPPPPSVEPEQGLK